jgi:hypothetical protein
VKNHDWGKLMYYFIKAAACPYNIAEGLLGETLYI